MDRPIGSTESARTAREVVQVDSATGAPLSPGQVTGVYNQPQIGLTAGQRADIQLNLKGEQLVAVDQLTAGEFASNTLCAFHDRVGGSRPLATGGYVFNGSTYDRQRGDATGGVWTQGPAAEFADPVGNPHLMAGKAVASPGVITDGKLFTLRGNLRGATYVQYLDSSGVVLQLTASFADGGAFINSFPAKSFNSVWNGATWDRARRPQNFSVSQTPATTNGAYSAGDVIGGKLTFAAVVPASGENGEIDAVIVRFKTDQSTPAPRLDLVLLKADPTATSLTDNDPYALNAADYDKVVTVIPLTTYSDHGSVSSVEKAWGRKFKLSGATLYGYLVTRDAITLGSTSDVSVELTTAAY